MAAGCRKAGSAASTGLALLSAAKVGSATCGAGIAGALLAPAAVLLLGTDKKAASPPIRSAIVRFAAGPLAFCDVPLRGAAAGKPSGGCSPPIRFAKLRLEPAGGGCEGPAAVPAEDKELDQLQGLVGGHECLHGCM